MTEQNELVGRRPGKSRRSRRSGGRTGRVGAAVAALVTFALIGASIAPAAPGGYDDVPSDAFYAEAVAKLAELYVFDGTECQQGFCPSQPIDRKTMAVWLVRVLDGGDPPRTSESRFRDVDLDGFHLPFIERLAELEVTQGCGDARFCPDDPVTRAQMAAFLSRAFNLGEGAAGKFTDVAGDAWFADSVARLVTAQITAGCGDGTRFCPYAETTRAQMATFLGRALGMTGLTAPPSSPPAQTPSSPVTSTPAKPGSTPSEDTRGTWSAADIAAAEAFVAELTNELRVGLGLEPLQYHDGLAAVARAWSQTLADTGEFFHNPRYSQQIPTGWSYAGENIALIPTSTIRQAAQEAFDGWVNSPGHYANMVRPQFTHIGVGVAFASPERWYQYFWLTQNFARYR